MCSFHLKMHENPFWPHWGAYDAPLEPQLDEDGNTSSLTPRRLRLFRLSTFRASLPTTRPRSLRFYIFRNSLEQLMLCHLKPHMRRHK